MKPLAKSSKESYAAEVNAALNQALSHPLRHRILGIMSERAASPTEVAKELGESREKVAYHVRLLAGLLRDDAIPLIELVHTDRRHGGREHFYQAVVRPVIDTPAASQLSQLTREVTSVAIVDKVIEDLTGSIGAGIFDSHPARSLLRMEILVDDEGLHKTGEIMMRCLAELTEARAESADRMAETGEQGTPLATALLAFPKA